MDERRKSVFDWRDGKPPQSAPPSATADALRKTTQSALAWGGAARSRQTNIMPKVFDLPTPSVPDRSGSNIRYMTPDGKPPGDPLNTAQRDAKDLFAQARRTNDLADRSALLREALGTQDFARAALGARTDLDTTRQRLQSAGDIANVNAQVDTNNMRLRSATDLSLGDQSSADQRYGIDTRARVSRDNTTDTLLQRSLSDVADRGLREKELAATNDYRNSRLQQTGVGSYSFKDHAAMLAEYPERAGTAAERDSLEAALYGTTNPGEQLLIKKRILALDESLDNPVQHAAGGLVQSYAGGGIVEPGMGAPPALAQPLAPDPALIAKYTQYAEGAQAMGLTTVGFEEFAQMSRGARAATGTAPPPSGAGAPVAMAEGGEVPVGGKMVIDSDPNAPTDSIPAVIDGKTPAALDSGELVFPRHAVLYYGTDKLNKMIAKSKEASEGGNGKSATGLNG